MKKESDKQLRLLKNAPIIILIGTFSVFILLIKILEGQAN